ncbi:MAG: prepilin peptidase [bacterium]|nr:prepilin peptidase [bacterium]
MLYAISFIFGTLVGSFLHLVATRLPKGEDIVASRSQCAHCKVTLGPADLIPLFSFIALRARCRSCRKPLSWSYPAVEALCGILFLVPVFVYGTDWINTSVLLHTVLGWFFLSGLLVLFLMDFWYRLVPDAIVLPLIAAAVIVQLFTGRMGWYQLVLGLVIGFGWFGIQWLVSKGKWVGGGDMRLGALAGALVGFPGILIVFFFTYVVGALCAVVGLATGRFTLKGEFPLGTTLTMATALVYFVPTHVFISLIS